MAQVLHFAKAAKALYLSQPVLSRHIQALEEELGMQLLIRTSHQVVLTEAGKILAKDGTQLLDRLDAALQQLRQETGALQGAITLGMSLEFSYSRHIRSFIQAFGKDNPRLLLDCQVYAGSNDRTVIGSRDLFFSPCLFHDYPPARRALIRRHGICAILPPEHPLLAKQAVYLHQLQGQTIIVPYADELFGPYAQNYLMAERATKGRVSCMKAATLPTALYLVSLGKGICLAPHYAKSLLNGAFALPVSERSCTFPEYLYVNAAEDSPAMEFFRRFPGVQQA